MSSTTKTRQGIAGDLAELGSHAGELAQERYQELKSGAMEWASEGRERLQEFEQTMEDYVAENPVKSVLMAAIAGLIVGRFVLR
jgi:ElaB/YqjD/DUF883 family membrane-anchored ribosome-binding protein